VVQQAAGPEAWTREAARGARTHTGDILGTLRYMAPEQFDGRGDARSDLYSLGLTLYEMLALRPAFDAGERHSLVRQVMGDTPEPLRKLDPRIPRDLETVVHKAIERDPARRSPTAGDLAADLRRFLADEPIRARRVWLAERMLRWARPSMVGISISETAKKYIVFSFPSRGAHYIILCSLSSLPTSCGGY
jgi:serine/threonine protein kinase